MNEQPAIPPSTSSTDPSIPSDLADLADLASRSEPGCPGRTRHGFFAGLLLGVLAAGLVGFAIGATMPVADAAIGALSHRFGSDAGGPPTIEEARDRAEFFAAFALHRLDATPDQEKRVQTIVDGLVADVFPLAEKHRANRDALHAILAAPTIDRAAIERLRSEEIALADSFSRAAATAIADTGDVLTTEQRAALMERLARFRHRH
jgi:protein CpxP